MVNRYNFNGGEFNIHDKPHTYVYTYRVDKYKKTFVKISFIYYKRV